MYGVILWCRNSRTRCIEYSTYLSIERYVGRPWDQRRGEEHHVLGRSPPSGHFRSTRIYALMQPNVCVDRNPLAGEL